MGFEKKHAKLSASGSEKWMKCPGSIALSEGIPDKTSKWAEEGTRAHQVVELMLDTFSDRSESLRMIGATPEMTRHGAGAANFILDLLKKSSSAELLVETRSDLSFIHPDMWGTLDSCIVEPFGTLHVFDYKYGAGVPVSPQNNHQLLFYGIGLAARYGWNFKRVRLWIIQPRIKSYEGPLFWELGVEELYGYVDIFRKAVERVEKEPKTYVEGSHCRWCKAKAICPLKQKVQFDKAKAIFAAVPLEEELF